MRELYKNIGTSVDRELLADAEGVERIGVAVYPGEGELERGTIIARDAASGLYKAAVSGAMSGKMLAVLDEPVDAGAEAEGVGESARAYLRGVFILEKLVLAAGGVPSEADLVALAAMDIRVRSMTGTVDNEVTE